MLESSLSSSSGIFGIVKIFVDQEYSFFAFIHETDTAIALPTEPTAEGARLVVVVAAQTLAFLGHLLASPAPRANGRSWPDLPPNALEVATLSCEAGLAAAIVDLRA